MLTKCHHGNINLLMCQGEAFFVEMFFLKNISLVFNREMPRFFWKGSYSGPWKSQRADNDGCGWPGEATVKDEAPGFKASYNA